jgi:hypothetical protein
MLFRSEAFCAILIAREVSWTRGGVDAANESDDGSSARTSLAGPAFPGDLAAAPPIGTTRTPRQHPAINLFGSIKVLAGETVRGW